MISRSIQKYKHIVDFNWTNFNAFTGIGSTTLIVGADNPIITSGNTVQTRARVKAIYFELSVVPNAVNAPQNIHWYIWFNPQQALTAVAANVVGTSTIKNFVIKQGMIQTYMNVATVIPPKIYGLIRIPPKYQRFMIGDALYFSWSEIYQSQSDSIQGKAIYKEIRG